MRHLSVRHFHRRSHLLRIGEKSAKQRVQVGALGNPRIAGHVPYSKLQRCAKALGCNMDMK